MNVHKNTRLIYHSRVLIVKRWEAGEALDRVGNESPSVSITKSKINLSLVKLLVLHEMRLPPVTFKLGIEMLF
jgi:hypothetical protein